MILSKTLKYVVLSGLQSVKRPHFHPKNSDEKFETLENFPETLENFFKTSNGKKISLDEIFIAPNRIFAVNHAMLHRLAHNENRKPRDEKKSSKSLFSC
jgi:hypothetical protein